MKYKVNIWIAALVILTTTAYGEQQGTESQEEVFRRHSDRETVQKCGTPLLMQLLDSTVSESAFKQAYNEASRPGRDTYADSDHFRVHYNTKGSYAPDPKDTNLNGVPDFVDSTLTYLEYARTKLIELGYGTPRSDGSLGGSSATDCYLTELSAESVYGYTMPDNTGLNGTVSSYIILDNNYTDTIYQTYGYDGLRITSAHEYFHVIQFSYYGGSDAAWWMEQTAVWFEDYAWDDVNDYLNWISLMFNNRDTTIDTYNGSFEYAAALNAMHIGEHYGIDMIRSIWNRFRDKRSGAVSVMSEALPNGIGAALADLGVWLYFTGSRANTGDFFDESNLMNNIILPGTYVTSLPRKDGVTFNNNYTFKYIEVVPQENFAAGDTLVCTLSDSKNGNWDNRVIFYNDPHNYNIHEMGKNGGSIPIHTSWKKAIIVAANSDDRSLLRRTYTYNIDIKSPVEVKDKPLPEPLALKQNYPNPFNPVTTIPFTLPEDGHVTLRVLNLQGQVVSVLLDGYEAAGSHTVQFDASSLPSGTYIAQIISGSHTVNRKMLMLK